VKRIDTALPGVCILDPVVHGDHRGFFMEMYHERAFAALGIHHRFVQDNYSRSTRHVLRGLHYQLTRPQAKLVRVVRGEVFDVAVDVRRGSPTFGKWVGETLTEDNRKAMFIPEGFAHGFLVLSEVAEFIYKCSDFYDPSDERGVIWNDPEVGIRWPLGSATPTLSGKDARYGMLKQLPEADFPEILA